MCVIKSIIKSCTYNCLWKIIFIIPSVEKILFIGLGLIIWFLKCLQVIQQHLWKLLFFIQKKGTTFGHDFGYSFSLFSYLLKKGGRRKEKWIAKIVIKSHAVLLDPIFYNTLFGALKRYILKIFSYITYRQHLVLNSSILISLKEIRKRRRLHAYKELPIGSNQNFTTWAYFSNFV
jgi:hypothetical protein